MCFYAVRELIRHYKHHKYKDRFPEIIVDDGYGDIHRTIYPNELLAIKLFSTCYRDMPIFAETMSRYLRSELEHAKKAYRDPKKRRKGELITVLNIMTIIRRECDGMDDH